MQTIRTANGQQAVILVDATTRQPLKIHSLISRHSSDSDSLPFTMKDVDADLSSVDYGKVRNRCQSTRCTFNNTENTFVFNAY